MARRSISDASDKWARRTQQATQDYANGISKPRRDWAQASVDASARRNAGLQQAIADGRIDKGIQRAGTGKWQRAASTKGVQNWAPAVQQAKPQYQAGLQRSYSYMDAADAATAGMATTTKRDRIAKAAAYLQAVADAADAAKASGG